MMELSVLEPIDYLLIGHLTVDLTPNGMRIGGSVTYSALLAQALGLRVGVITSWGSEIPLGPLKSVPMINTAPIKAMTRPRQKPAESFCLKISQVPSATQRGEVLPRSVALEAVV